MSSEPNDSKKDALMELLLSSALYLETWGSESVENRLRFAQLMTELPRKACSVTLLRPVLFSVH